MRRALALTQLSACFRGRVQPGFVWADVLELANRSLVTPHLCASLSDTELPDDVEKFSAEVCRRNVLRNRQLHSTLCEAVSALNSAGIEPILLKGCATWARANGALEPDGNRLISDLDLMVKPSEGDLAVEALRGIEFRVLENHAADDDHVVAILGRDWDAGTIDLHYRPPTPTGISALEDLHRNSEPVRVGGGRALVPRPELQVLIGALHDLAHDGFYWLGDFNLRHLIDTKQLLTRDSFDWDFLDRACADGFVRAMTTLQLRCAFEIAGADVPRRWLSSLRAYAHYRRMRLQYELSWLRPPLAWFGHLIKWRDSPVRARVKATA